MVALLLAVIGYCHSQEFIASCDPFFAASRKPCSPQLNHSEFSLRQNEITLFS